MIKKWIEAARPRTLPTSVSPVIAASAYAWYIRIIGSNCFKFRQRLLRL